jgi:AraC-like DNA-binding protein
MRHNNVGNAKLISCRIMGAPAHAGFRGRGQYMTGIPLTRCQFLIPFAGIHTEIGAPTAALLGRLRLPTSLEEKANHYVPILPAIAFAEAAQRSQGIADFGFQASRRLGFCHLSDKIRAIVGHAPTLYAALQRVCRWAPQEDTILKMWLERHSDHARICSTLTGTTGLLHLEHSQWLQNVLPIHIVRQFAGPAWTPATIAFEARYTPSAETRSLWPGTRFLSGQDASWIDVPLALLGLANCANEMAPDVLGEEAGPPGNEMIEALKLMLPSYLDEGTPTVSQIAEMARVSVRSLQRKLSSAGLSYSGLLEAARFETAARRLHDTDARIIDVAFSCGYTDPAHFTRAFRRISGLTPRQYRESRRPL